jgi:hypothetical protein
MAMVEEIQPGWRVADSFGEEIGTVLALNGQNVRVKLYGGGELEVSGSDCADIETGRVELSKTKKDLQAAASVKPT